MTPREPSPEECTARAKVDGGWAGWYPQMGGYVGRCVAIPDGGEDPCWDVYVWHDGEFPFSGDDMRGQNGPVRIHHCDPDQFVDFGQWLIGLSEAGSVIDTKGST